VKTEGILIEEHPRGGPEHNVPLGTLVLRAGLMPQERIEAALQQAVSSGCKLGEVLVERGLEERELTRLLAAQHAQPFVDLTEFRIDWETARLLPPSVAEMYCALPIGEVEDALAVAVPDPRDERQRERLHRALQRRIKFVAAARADIMDAIDKVATAAPEPARFDVVVTLIDGTTQVVGTARRRSDAEAMAERAVAQARIGSLIRTRATTIDGTDVVSVEVAALGRLQ
jgi:hypothetical protein